VFFDERKRTIMDRRVYLVVAILVLTAGCSVGPFAADADTDQPETLTPVPVTDADRTPTRGVATASPPEGVFLNETVRLDRLIDAHVRSLADTTYRWRFRRTFSPLPPALERNFTRRVAVGEDAVRLEDARSAGDRVSAYVTDTTAYWRTIDGNETTVRVDEATQDPRMLAPAPRLMREYMTDLEFTVSRVERDGGTFYRLYSSPGRPPPTVLDGSTDIVWNYAATAYVTPSGTVLSLTVSWTTATGEGSSRTTLRFEYDRVGSTTVDRPDWASGATDTSTPD
jgi:hypothetical protein